MSADWNTPSLATAYATLLGILKDRDVDAYSLAEAPTNPPTGAIRYNRSLDKFQEWSGAAWVDLVLSLAGGGTAGNDAASARTSLGLGGMALQDPAAVAITGGSITGIAGISPLVAKGDIYAFSTVNDRLPVGPDFSRLESDPSVALGVKWTDPLDILDVEEDFINPNSSGATVKDAGASVAAESSGGGVSVGTILLDTGNTNNNRCAIVWPDDGITLVAGDKVAYACFRLGMTQITNAVYVAGFVSNNVSYPNFGNDGVYVRYNTAVDGQMRFVTRKGGAETATVIQASIVASTKYKYEIKKSGSNYLCYVDGVLKATHTTNIPTNPLTRMVGAKTLVGGVASRAISLDYVRLRITGIGR